jgi:hypothetical protein
MENHLKSTVSVFAVVCASACGASTEAPSSEPIADVEVEVDTLRMNAPAPRRFAVIPGKARVFGRSMVRTRPTTRCAFRPRPISGGSSRP